MEDNTKLTSLIQSLNLERDENQNELSSTFQEQLTKWITYFDLIISIETGLSDAIYLAYFITELNFKYLIIHEYNISNYNSPIGVNSILFKDIGHRFENYLHLCKQKDTIYIKDRISNLFVRINRIIKPHFTIRECESIKYENYKYNFNKEIRIFRNNNLTPELIELLKEIVSYGRY